MNTCKLLVALLLLLTTTACGVKSDPVPNEAFFIPYPKEVTLSSHDGGVLVKNNSKSFVVLVEVRNDDPTTPVDEYKRLSLISPGQSYIDTNVSNGEAYSYRFSNYYQEYNTYSYSVIKTIVYEAPVKIYNLTMEERNYNICIKAELGEHTEFASISLNGRNIGLLSDYEQCFALPYVAAVEVLLMPFDKYGVTGTPISRTFKRDLSKVLLPPQNISVIRHNDRIVLSWDASLSPDTEYAIYMIEDDKSTLLTKTNITVESIVPDEPNGCVTFELASYKGTNESPHVTITSCP